MVGRKAGLGFGVVSGCASASGTLSGGDGADSSALTGFIVGRNAGFDFGATGCGWTDSGVIVGVLGPASVSAGLGGFIVGRKPAGLATGGSITESG